MPTKQNLMDSDGENMAVRTFLLNYNNSIPMSIGDMKAHMFFSGWDGYWPVWVELPETQTHHLTKLGAQMWLRYLFSLERPLSS